MKRFSFIILFIFAIYIWGKTYYIEKKSLHINTGWYVNNNNFLFFNREVNILFSNFQPKLFNLRKYKKNAGFEELSLKETIFSGCALTGYIKKITHYKNIKPLFGNDFYLISIDITPNIDHCVNTLQVLDIPLLSKNKMLIYFVYPLSKSNFKISIQGFVNNKYSFEIKPYWKLIGTLNKANSWNLLYLKPQWYGNDMKDLFFMINDEPVQNGKGKFEFLIDGIFILPQGEVKAEISSPILTYIGKSFKKRFLKSGIFVTFFSTLLCILFAFFLKKLKL